jgi:hypothetical protein
MRNFFENKIAFAATFSMFALAFACNFGNPTQSFTGKFLFKVQPLTQAHGPMVPPDPWSGGSVTVAHGPMVPPDPWSGGSVIVAHGPMVPPDPWSGGSVTVAHGPMVPPDPWSGGSITRA